eukprot:6459037-Amphidinium_carterae.1
MELLILSCCIEGSARVGACHAQTPQVCAHVRKSESRASSASKQLTAIGLSILWSLRHDPTEVGSHESLHKTTCPWLDSRKASA